MHNHLLFKAVLVLHIAIVLQGVRLGPQNEGGGLNNTGHQINVAQRTSASFSYHFRQLFSDRMIRNIRTIKTLIVCHFSFKLSFFF